MEKENELLNTETAKKHPNTLFEQYKLFVESVEKTSQRRDTANQFYLGLNTAIITITGYLTNQAITPASILLPIAGILINYHWHQIINSYKNLNTGKFKVIDELEKNMPAKLYSYEWKILEEGKTKKYKPITHIETGIPWIFVALNLIIFLYSIYELIKTT